MQTLQKRKCVQFKRYSALRSAQVDEVVASGGSCTSTHVLFHYIQERLEKAEEVRALEAAAS